MKSKQNYELTRVEHSFRLIILKLRIELFLSGKFVKKMVYKTECYLLTRLPRPHEEDMRIRCALCYMVCRILFSMYHLELIQ